MSPSGENLVAIESANRAHRELMFQARSVASEMRRRYRKLEPIRLVLLLRQAALVIEKEAR